MMPRYGAPTDEVICAPCIINGSVNSEHLNFLIKNKSSFVLILKLEAYKILLMEFFIFSPEKWQHSPFLPDISLLDFSQ